MRKKIKYPEIGSVVEINLESGRKTYARILKRPLMAFYSAAFKDSCLVDEVIRSPIAFKVWVMSSAITSGRWPVVGYAPIESDLLIDPYFFKQDVISKKIYIYRDGMEIAASKEDCLGLECAAVWSAEHIESRLEDYLNDRPNRLVEGLSLD